MKLFFSSTSLWRKIKNNVPELEELNMFGIGDQQLTTLQALFEFDLNANSRSCIACPKPADTENVIWNIPICIDC